MSSFRVSNLAITIEKDGASNFTKASYPIRFGKYHEIRTSDHEFQFNLKGEIKFIRGLSGNWPHPSEWIKRTDGNDWVYYSVSGFKGIYKWLGEYYLPCLPYPSNSIWAFNPYTDSNVLTAFAAWSQLYGSLREMQADGIPPQAKDLIDLISYNDENTLFEKANTFHSFIGGQVSVLPPDTRHVDYEVIPLIIADGCLYHCNFCFVKTNLRYQSRSKENIFEQIRQLTNFYGGNLGNYNALFLGNHDALGAGDELIRMAVSEAIQAFGFENANVENPSLFLFGSVDSLLKAGNELMKELNELPFYTYINIGFESVDAKTLKSIHKPLEVSKIKDAFQKMLEINCSNANIEITGNFLLGEQLSPEHNQSLADLLESIPEPFQGKGAIYLSPLVESRKKPDLLETYFEIKNRSKLPVYIYLIQRL
ncbi:MAG: radical SAM protein [Desulfobacterales bacterium]|nr:radical SAM protein [Desulfobacterales bacterium]